MDTEDILRDYLVINAYLLSVLSNEVVLKIVRRECLVNGCSLLFFLSVNIY